MTVRTTARRGRWPDVNNFRSAADILGCTLVAVLVAFAVANFQEPRDQSARDCAETSSNQGWVRLHGETEINPEAVLTRWALTTDGLLSTSPDAAPVPVARADMTGALAAVAEPGKPIAILLDCPAQMPFGAFALAQSAIEGRIQQLSEYHVSLGCAEQEL